jgi:hypothetical protein
MWDLWWTKWHCDRFSPSTSAFRVQYNSTNAAQKFLHPSVIDDKHAAGTWRRQFCNNNSGVFCEAGTPFFGRWNYVHKIIFPLRHAASPHQCLLPLTIWRTHTHAQQLSQLWNCSLITWALLQGSHAVWLVLQIQEKYMRFMFCRFCIPDFIVKNACQPGSFHLHAKATWPTTFGHLKAAFWNSVLWNRGFPCSENNGH